jgi:hypothetical protein
VNKLRALVGLSRVIGLSTNSLVASVVLALGQGAVAQTAVDGTGVATFRSLPEAVDALGQRYGYGITVEVPPYVYDGDLQDERALRKDSGRSSSGTPPPIWVAKGVPSVLSLPPADKVGRSDLSSMVKQLTQDASKSDHGAHFRVEQDGDVLHIIPTEVRDAKGNWAAYTPLFDTRISIPTKERSLLETVEVVCSALETAKHIPVRLLVYPLNTLHYTNSTVGANDEMARTALTRALTGVDRKLTWRVFYDIPMNSYLLSIIFVSPRVPSAIPQQPMPAAPNSSARAGSNSASPATSAPKQ